MQPMLSEVCSPTTRRSTAVAAGRCSRASIASTSTTGLRRSWDGGRASISATFSTACSATRTCSVPWPGQSVARATTREASRMDPIQSSGAGRAAPPPNQALQRTSHSTGHWGLSGCLHCGEAGGGGDQLGKPQRQVCGGLPLPLPHLLVDAQSGDDEDAIICIGLGYSPCLLQLLRDRKSVV